MPLFFVLIPLCKNSSLSDACDRYRLERYNKWPLYVMALPHSTGRFIVY